MRTILISVLLVGLGTASVAFAAGGIEGSFQPIAPLPAPGGGVATESGSLDQYINAAFQIALGIGAAMAVINIGIGGFEYMMSDVVTAKGEGRKRITSALYGLLLLLMVYIILYVINPDILSLKLFPAQ